VQGILFWTGREGNGGEEGQKSRGEGKTWEEGRSMRKSSKKVNKEGGERREGRPLWWAEDSCRKMRCGEEAKTWGEGDDVPSPERKKGNQKTDRTPTILLYQSKGRGGGRKRGRGKKAFAAKPGKGRGPLRLSKPKIQNKAPFPGKESFQKTKPR